MKKLAIYSGIVFVMALCSCENDVCVQCTPIPGQAGEVQELCSRDADERQTFQTELIFQGYNCAEVE